MVESAEKLETEEELYPIDGCVLETIVLAMVESAEKLETEEELYPTDGCVLETILLALVKSAEKLETEEELYPIDGCVLETILLGLVVKDTELLAGVDSLKEVMYVPVFTSSLAAVVLCNSVEL